MNTVAGCTLGGKRARVDFSPDRRLNLFLHRNSAPPVRLRPSLDALSVRNHLVSLGCRHRINVVEHLFSALYGSGIFNLRIDVHGGEIPFFDGSSLPFLAALKPEAFRAHNNPVPAAGLSTGFCVRRGDSIISYRPLPGPETFLTVDMTLEHPYIKKQRRVIRIDRKSYVEEIAPARTFIFTTEDDPRLKELPPYGLGITSRKIHSRSPLRFSDEPVRHKILDLLGDMFLLKQAVAGTIVGCNTSHRLNLRFVREFARRLNGSSRK